MKDRPGGVQAALAVGAALAACAPVQQNREDALPEDPGALDAGPLSSGGTGKPWMCNIGSTSGAAAPPASLAGSASGTALPKSTMSLQVAANPNSVLSGVATISWTGPIQSISIRYSEGSPRAIADRLGDLKAVTGSTPWFDLSSSTSPVTEPVLGLKPQTEYTLEAVGLDSNGNPVGTSSANFKTGALPADLPAFATTGTQSGAGFTLLSQLAVNYLQIVSGDGSPVWYYPVPAVAPVNGSFQQQPDGTFTYSANPPGANPASPGMGGVFRQIDALGNDIRTWTGLGPDGSGQIAADTRGNPVTVVSANTHELRLLPDGDALLFGITTRTMDLTSVGGQPDGTVYSDVLERVGTDGEVKFAWNVLDYVTQADGTGDLINSTTLDFDHANSIDVMPDGNYLVSLRNLSSVWKIDATTGDVLWRLGGARSDFAFVNDPLHGFGRQHDARALPNGNIILFDNDTDSGTNESRAAEYALDTTTSPWTATLVWSTSPGPGMFTPVMGGAQRMANGNTLVDYAQADTVMETDPTGTKTHWTLTVPGASRGIYRAYRLTSLYQYSPADACPPVSP
jgi:hypothetical protein